MSRLRLGFPRFLAAGALPLFACLLLLGLTLGSSSCSGDVVCVFTTGCNDDGGNTGAGSPATLPEDGQWIKDGPPAVADVFPSGGDEVASTAPVVITFSESMNPQSVFGAFVLIPILGGVPGPPLPGVTQAMVGEDRVLLLLPAALDSNVDEYEVRLLDDAVPTDITGQILDLAGGALVDSFTVARDDPLLPSVLTTWPAGSATQQGETSEIVVVFDRAMDATTVDGDSFDVLVDGGQPTEDPPPAALSISVGGFPITDSRVFLWRAVDGNDVPVSLGLDVPVKIELSPDGNKIQDQNGEELPATNATFQTNDLGTPLSSNLLSNPADAMGLANLTAGDPEELLVQVDLLNGEEGDKVDLFLFGMTTDDESQLVALSRSVTLTGAPPILTANFTLADVDILASADPITPRFADGAVSFAFRLRRGGQITPLDVIDVDPNEAGIQDVILDTVAPTIDELLYTNGATDFFRSDQRDIVLTGTASELLRSVEVTTPLGTNAALAPVIGSNEAGYFVAAPVDTGILNSGTTTYSAVGYDAALNASAAISGTFTQLGAVGPGTILPGIPVDVQVFDAVTFRPLANALVIVHGDDGDGTGYPFVASGLTDANGELSIASYAGGRSILSVDVDGYDLFTFHSLTSARVSVPVVPVGTGPSANVDGTAGTDNGLATLTLTLLNSKVGDSRRAVTEARYFDGGTCFDNPFAGELTCPFGPEPIFPDRLGAQSWIAGSFQQVVFNPISLIQAFDFIIPTSPIPSGGTDTTAVWIPYVFVDPAAPMNELPLAITPVTLLAGATTGIDLLDLVGDPLTTGSPWITVETVSPGIPDAIPVGLGISFEQAANLWIVNSAYPGAVGDAGYFGARGIVDTDFFVRAELRDSAGNRAGQRPRVSALPDLVVPNTLIPGSVPQITAPTPGGSSGGASYNIEFLDTVPDVLSQQALYRVRLIDDTGRGWTLWRPDSVDIAGPGVIVRVPDLTEGGGTVLADGTIAAALSVFGLPDRSLDLFLWSDIPREHDLFAHSAPVTYIQP